MTLFKNRRNAFTLIELLVVIAIIGLLAVIALISLGHARANARDAKRLADMKQMQTALALYYDSAGHYPSNAEIKSGKLSFYSPSMNTTTFMEVIPSAPMPADGPCSSAETAYTYNAPADGSTYTINFCISKRNGDLPAGNLVAWSGGINGGSGKCKPDCSGKNCGDNGCGGSCGSCPDGQSCGDDQIGVCGASYSDGSTPRGSGVVFKITNTDSTSYHRIKTVSDGYIIIGGAGGYDDVIKKLNTDGSEAWSKPIVLSGYTHMGFTKIEEISGGYRLFGNDSSHSSSALIINLDTNGNFVSAWTPYTSGSIFDVSKTTDGGYILAISYYNGSGFIPLISKIDSDGNSVWLHSIANMGEPYAIVSVGNGKHVISSRHGSDIYDYLAHLFQIDESGNIEWDKTIPIPDIRDPRIMIRDLSGNFFLVDGFSNDDMVKFDSSGNKIWKRNFPLLANTPIILDGVLADNGNYILVGQDQNNFAMLAEMDVDGNLISRRYLDKSYSRLISVDKALDGGYIAIGENNGSVYVIKTDASGLSSACQGQCTGVCGGETGCGGYCQGSCASQGPNYSCSNGYCQCNPSCAADSCDSDDGCGGICYDCSSGYCTYVGNGYGYTTVNGYHCINY